MQCVAITAATIRMASSVMVVRHGLQCVTAGSGSINYDAMMSRIATRAPDVTATREQAEREQQLLVLYNATLPDMCPPTSDNMCVHQSSMQLLSDHCSKQYIPASVAGEATACSGQCRWCCSAISRHMISYAYSLSLRY